MLSNYQLKIPDFYGIPIGIVKRLIPNFFDKEKYILKQLPKANIETKKIHRVLESNQSQCLNSYFEFNTKKNNRSRTKW